ncbi:uncharacterized protein RCO7_03764 [Rhynchosporium graminicola]|uniref:Uncharacterized protein n=1 Tax=Rhynchosporium graminicola TaxID=2792576 RepID=A0A1E1LGP0_9HELO|nr:uncharacterized protein RCO7_03764 [Rhynchosporium commune]
MRTSIFFALSLLLPITIAQSCAKTNADRTVDCKDYDTCELIINSGIGSCNVGEKTNGCGLGRRGSQLYVSCNCCYGRPE